MDQCLLEKHWKLILRHNVDGYICVRGAPMVVIVYQDSVITRQVLFVPCEVFPQRA